MFCSQEGMGKQPKLGGRVGQAVAMRRVLPRSVPVPQSHKVLLLVISAREKEFLKMWTLQKQKQIYLAFFNIKPRKVV